MRIIKANNDNLKPAGIAPESVASGKGEDPLVFWTGLDGLGVRVDLHEFSEGRSSPNTNGGGAKNWGGALTGRPQLIFELAPAIQQKLTGSSPRTVDSFQSHLRSWWRLFDTIEAEALDSGTPLVPLRSVIDLTHLHQLRAVQTMDANEFSSLASVADTTRRALGLPPTHWRGPEQKKREATGIPEYNQLRPLYSALKTGWFRAVDRWARVRTLLSGSAPHLNAFDERLLSNARFLAEALQASIANGGPFPSPTALVARYEAQHGVKRLMMHRRGLNPLFMYATVYPTPDDIRFAFHLALFGSGWNVSTLLDLEVDVDSEAGSRTPFLRDHPSNTEADRANGTGRYILTGYKARGASYHDVHGDWKTTRSPGVIVKTLVDLTWPLRVELLRQAKEAEHSLLNAERSRDEKRIQHARERYGELKHASRSVWLYFDNKGIQALSEATYSKQNGSNWLNALIHSTNANLAANQHIPAVKASDFRDVYAMWVYESTGGNILAVRRALNHRRVSTTAAYLFHRTLEHKGNKRLLRLEHALWEQICDEGRLDVTRLRHLMEHGRHLPFRYNAWRNTGS